MSIKLVKRVAFTVSAGFIVLSSINTAHAFQNLCGAVGASQIGAPTACADCHTGANPSGNNYTGGCSPIAPPAPAPMPAPAPTPTPGGGMNNGGMNNGDSGMRGGNRMKHQEERMRRHQRSDDRRGSNRRHGRDDD